VVWVHVLCELADLADDDSVLRDALHDTHEQRLQILTAQRGMALGTLRSEEWINKENNKNERK
jgi:hypothetical protein